jgi:hypothetical protein
MITVPVVVAVKVAVAIRYLDTETMVCDGCTLNWFSSVHPFPPIIAVEMVWNGKTNYRQRPNFDRARIPRAVFSICGRRGAPALPEF